MILELTIFLTKQNKLPIILYHYHLKENLALFSNEAKVLHNLSK